MLVGRAYLCVMQLRLATLGDLDLLRAWDEKPHNIAAKGSDGDPWPWDYELPRIVPWRELLIGEVDGRPVGIMQIIDAKHEETHYWGNVEEGLRAIDIWLGEESDLGRGYGSEMMRLAILRCFSDLAVNAILIDPLVSNVRAHRFYERCGFSRIGRQMFDDDDCYVYRLKREDWLAGQSALV